MTSTVDDEDLMERVKRVAMPIGGEVGSPMSRWRGVVCSHRKGRILRGGKTSKIEGGNRSQPWGHNTFTRRKYPANLG